MSQQNTLLETYTYSGTDISVYAVISPEALSKATEKAKEFNDSLALDIANTLAGGGDANFFASDTNYPERTDEQYIKMISDLNNTYKKLGELQTISVSIYRDKEPVKRLGKDTVNGFTRGFTTLAGTMIFAVIKEDVFAELLSKAYKEESFPGQRADQLPPLDLFLIFSNEIGGMAKMSLFGVEFLNEGQVMSVQDLYTETSITYVAKEKTRLKDVNSIYPDMYDVSHLTAASPVSLIVQSEYYRAKALQEKQKDYFL